MRIPDSRRHGWWYLKVYLDQQFEDDLLKAVVNHLQLAVHPETAADQWFFVRYSDMTERAGAGSRSSAGGPLGSHLRLRLRCSGSRFALLERQLRGTRWGSERTAPTIVADRYEPEVDRYGGPAGMDPVHEIFTVDSMNTIALRPAVVREPVTAAASAFEFVLQLGWSGELVEIYAERIRRIARDLGTGEQELARSAKPLLRTFAKRWPTARAAVRGCETLALNAPQLQDPGARLREAARHGSLTRPLRSIAAELHHMHFNRLGIGTRQELSLVLLTGLANDHGLVDGPG